MTQVNDLEMTMHMTIKWKTQCSFIFESWSTDTVWGLIIGLVFTAITACLSIAMPSLKKIISTRLFSHHSTSVVSHAESQQQQVPLENKKQSGQETIFNFVYVFLYSTLHIATMMLLMTFNGYVILGVIMGLTVGYFMFGLECDKDKNLPVNCCA